MRRIFMMALVIAAVGLVSSCGSSKTAQSEVYETPCSGPGFRTEASHFRASASAIAGNEDVARKQATASARQELATIINTTIKAVADNYAKNYVKGEEAESTQRYEDLGRTVVNQRLTGSHTICEKYRKNANGTYTCYVCVELASEDVLAALNSSISDDSKLRIDYDYEKFKKVFEEEMAKMQ